MLAVTVKPGEYTTDNLYNKGAKKGRVPVTLYTRQPLRVEVHCWGPLVGSGITEQSLSISS